MKEKRSPSQLEALWKESDMSNGRKVDAMVVILRTAPIYEINRHRQLREVGAVDRAPLYNSTDWNYIRFTCGRMSYELYNDTLRPCAS